MFISENHLPVAKAPGQQGTMGFEGLCCDGVGKWGGGGGERKEGGMVDKALVQISMRLEYQLI